VHPGARAGEDTLHSLAGLAAYLNAAYDRWGKQAYQPIYAAAVAQRRGTTIVCSPHV